MPETGNALSRNPNICASCSSMADGMEESATSENAGLHPAGLTPARTEALMAGRRGRRRRNPPLTKFRSNRHAGVRRRGSPASASFRLAEKLFHNV